MSTTDEFAQCSKCAALLNDTDEDIAKHRRWHAQWDQAFETIRRVASTASTDVTAMQAQIRDMSRLQAPTEPQRVHIRVTDDDELEPDADELAELAAETFDDTIERPMPTAVAGMDDDDYPPPLPTSDDDLDTRLANATGSVPNLGPLT